MSDIILANKQYKARSGEIEPLSHTIKVCDKMIEVSSAIGELGLSFQRYAQVCDAIVKKLNQGARV